jgi:hypothetical protein
VTKSLKDQLYRQSVSLIAALEHRANAILLGWTIIASLLFGLRAAFTPAPVDGWMSALETLLPYVLVISAPVAAWFIGNALFRSGQLYQPPAIRLARYGKWRNVDCLSARAHPAFGPTGIMASLVLGMLLNVPVRSLEFLAAVPALNSNAPLWGQMLLGAMTLDVMVMNFFYVLAFIMALRSVPWFPRFLLAVWCVDIFSQLAIANYVGTAPHLPHGVGKAMASLLESNIQKVMISIVVWLPYLLLSERVNLTYRQRIAISA